MAISILGSALLVYTQIDNTFEKQPIIIDDVEIKSEVKVKSSPKEPPSDPNGNYLLWVGDRYINTYSDSEALKTYVATVPNGYITIKGSAEPVFEQAKQYKVKDRLGTVVQFGDIDEALFYAREHKASETSVYFGANDKLIWSYADKVSNKTNIKLDNILQNPELPRGCEVTSLAMLLNAGGVQVDKMELAANVRKDLSFREEINGQMFWGSPYYGFVGDMYDKSSDGYGVYNQAIYDLAAMYIPNNVVNLSGCDFSLVERFVSYGYPVWVIITGEYDELPESSFQSYMTKYGEINITQREHSVLVTGYDSNFVYINDPLGYKTKVKRSSFIKSYEQMGEQAISYVR